MSDTWGAVDVEGPRLELYSGGGGSLKGSLDCAVESDGGFDLESLRSLSVMIMAQGKRVKLYTKGELTLSLRRRVERSGCGEDKTRSVLESSLTTWIC